MADTGRRRGDGGTRQVLALTVVYMSGLGIILVAGATIFVADTARADTAQLVLGSVVPVFGTWAGTVLAFYFAQKSQQEATDRALDKALQLSGQVDGKTPVLHAMVTRSNIVSCDLNPGQQALDVKLSDLYARMQAAGRQRIPILTESGVVQYVVHMSTITGFANLAGPGGGPRDPSQLTETMGDLLGNAEFKKAVEAFGSVGPDAVLADARKEMGSIERCNDVFVTTNGRKGDIMIGWLTNTDLAGLE